MTLSYKPCRPSARIRTAAVVLAAMITYLAPATASACQPHIRPYTGMQSYHTIAGYERALIDRETTNIAIVRAQLGVIGDDPPQVSWEGAGQWVVFDTVDVLKGTAPADDPHWLPVASESFTAERDAETVRELDFDFWDQLDLRTARTPDATFMTSCGAESAPTVVPGQHYLAIFGKNDISFRWSGASTLVPVKDANDPLIGPIRDFVAGSPSPMRQSPREFAEHMVGYAEIRADTCPTKDSFRASFWTFESLASPRPGKGLTDIDSYGAAAMETRIVDAASYQRELKPRRTTCEDGRHYLALKRWDGTVPDSNWRGDREGPLVYRYLPITQGTVRRDDILSNIEITGPELIAVDDLKRWIRDANPDASHSPDPALLDVYETFRQTDGDTVVVQQIPTFE